MFRNLLAVTYKKLEIHCIIPSDGVTTDIFTSFFEKNNERTV